MRMRIALLQTDPTVGDLEGNAGLLLEAAGVARRAGADLAVASELSLLGYPPRDLLLGREFVARSWASCEDLARQLVDGPPLLVGLAEANPSVEGRPLYNAAALLAGGGVREVFRKTLLPTYDVFDEDRYFEPADGPQILSLGDQRFGVSVCEDVWNDRDFWHRRRYHTDPLEDLMAAGASCVLNMSASPFTMGKQGHREDMLGAIARKYAVPVLYVNQVGGADELVFDGRSCAFAADGELSARAAAFTPDVLVVDLEKLSGETEAAMDPRALAADDFAPTSEVWRALVLGVRDYVAKSGFERALLGLSGGIDSALVAAIAADALGPEHVHGVLMPSRYSSEGSVSDSLELAEALGIHTIELPVEAPFQAFLDTLVPVFEGREPDVAEENLQARVRGTLVMGLSNKFGWLPLATGNKSELAVGYSTLYGDMVGGFAPIKDVFKTRVYDLANWRNSQGDSPVIPQAIIDKPPSAELREGQVDQDSLPPYPVLDAILKHYVEKDDSREAIVAMGFPSEIVERVIRMTDGAEYKRRQGPVGVKITPKAFGKDRRMPITNGYIG